MANTADVDINRDPATGEVSFDPQTVIVAPGQIIFWRNNDEQEAHQPMPASGGADDAWVDLIPKKLPHQPAPTSLRQVSFAGATYAQGIAYVCALHPQETGTIISTNYVDITRVVAPQPGQPAASFAKATVNTQEAVTWRNNDSVAHWPAPSKDQPTAWLPGPIPGMQGNQPAPTSAVVSFNQASPQGGIIYVCAVEGHNETGTLIVNQPPTD